MEFHTSAICCAYSLNRSLKSTAKSQSEISSVYSDSMSAMTLPIRLSVDVMACHLNEDAFMSYIIRLNSVHSGILDLDERSSFASGLTLSTSVFRSLNVGFEMPA